MPDQRDDVLNYIKYNGPVLPVQIAKHINTNILFSSAILSELVARKILRITSASIGGSPLYYLPGQEEMMDARLCTALHGREKEAYNLLNEHKVLWEKEMEPWQRVAVKEIKDFSVQIIVNNNGQNEFFWKHTLVSDEEAKAIISQMINGIPPVAEPIEEKVEVPVEETNFAEELESNEEVVEEKPKLEELIQPEIKHRNIVKEKHKSGNFYTDVLEFLKDENIEIVKEELVKKDKEVDFVVNILSNFGKLRYFVKAKNKPSINEADVSMAFSEGQLRKMPVILLTNGKANKKALALIEQRMQGQLTFKEI